MHLCGLAHSDDNAIWEYARVNDFTIVTKDSDFQEKAVLPGAPPKVIWLRTRNCKSEQVASRLRSAFQRIQQFVEKDDETCLILS